MEDFKVAQRATWDAGDFPSVAERIADVGERVVEHAGIEPGMRVLDVACGAGNATFPAARAGAHATGLDLTPSLLEAGREKASAEGLEIEWVEGDAEDLPFEDGSFDRVLSTFGHMFAPRHRKTADEMARVCRKDGGMIAVCTWLPEGNVGRMFKAGASYLPPPPDFAQPPALWGTEEHVREMWGDVAKDFRFSRHVSWVEEESMEAWADFFFATFGPMITARQRLGDRFEEMRRDVIAVWEEANEADDGSLRFPQQYLLSEVRL